MPESLSQAVKQEPERFVSLVYEENPNIKDLDDFKTALFRKFNTPNGDHASRHFDDDIIVDLFLSNENRDRIKDNISDKKYDKMFTSIERSDSEIIRDKPVGKSIKAKEVHIFIVKKERSVKPHFRQRGYVKPYARSKAQEWEGIQVDFIKTRKARKMPSLKISKEYNEHFKEKRTIASIRTKLYRL